MRQQQSSSDPQLKPLEKNHFFTWKAGFKGASHQGASSPHPDHWGGQTRRFLPPPIQLRKTQGGRTQALKRRVPPLPRQVLDRNGRPSGARPRGRERARGQRDVADTLPRDLHVGLCPLVRKRPLTAPGTRLSQDPARARARRQLASSPPLPLPAARTRRYPARPLTGPAAPSSPRALPGGRRGDVTDARRSTANGKSQQGVGGARAGSPRPFHLPAEAARWSAVPQLLPGLSSQSSLLGRPEGPGSVHLF